MGEFFRRLRYLINRRRLDQELQNDMEVHREMAERDGRRFGNTLRLREDARQEWGWMWIDRLTQDLRYTVRTLRKSPGFTLTAVLVLAIGIGINITAFGIFDMSVLRPLPVRDADTIRQFRRSSSQAQGSSTLVAYPSVVFYGEHSTKLSAVMAMSASGLTLENEPDPLRTRFVTANFFAELGAGAALGRVLNPEWDNGEGGVPGVVLDYRFWQRRFVSDPSVIGRTIRLNRKLATVIGVASEKFTGLESGRSDIWAPIERQPYFFAGSTLLTGLGFGNGVIMWGRLRQGVAPQVAEEELRGLTATLHGQHPDDFWKDERLPSEPGGYASEMGPEGYVAFSLVAALVLLILVVACGNLGGLLLARGVAREREIAIRAALGAGRGRIIRQLFTESLLLTLVGSGVGLLLSCLLLRSWMVLTETPPWFHAAPDWRVAAFAICLGIAAAILFGVAPARQAACRPYLAPDSTRRQSESRFRKVLIGAQVAASCVLLIVAGLLARALQHALYTPPGFEYEDVIAIDPGLGAHGFNAAAARSHLDSLTSRLRQVPAVESVSLSSLPPLGNDNLSIIRMNLAGRRVDAYVNYVDPEFFHTMNIPLLRGRNLKLGDTEAIIVSESLARKEWPRNDALGKQLSTGTGAAGREEKYTVVGVAGSARIVALQDSDAVEIYRLVRDSDMPSVSVLVKLLGSSKSQTAAIASVAGNIDPQAIPIVRPLWSAFHAQFRPLERGALLVAVMGAVALLLSVLGIVGLLAYTVSQRTKEIGIRIALGAQPSQLLRAILGHFLWPVTLGVLLGAAGAAALSQLLRHALYGVGSLDPVSYSAAIGLLVAISVSAILVPARRALRVDPMLALRHD
jgi:predicted permease